MIELCTPTCAVHPYRIFKRHFLHTQTREYARRLTCFSHRRRRILVCSKRMRVREWCGADVPPTRRRRNDGRGRGGAFVSRGEKRVHGGHQYAEGGRGECPRTSPVSSLRLKRRLTRGIYTCIIRYIHVVYTIRHIHVIHAVQTRGQYTVRRCLRGGLK